MKIYRELEEFKKQCEGQGLCDPYTKAWMEAETKEELMALATDINGMPYIMEAMTRDYANLDKKFVLKEFGEFINNGYSIPQQGFTSVFYIDPIESEIKLKDTVCGLFDYNGKVILDHHICHIYTNSSIGIIGKGEVYLHRLEDGVWHNDKIKIG